MHTSTSPELWSILEFALALWNYSEARRSHRVRVNRHEASLRQIVAKWKSADPSRRNEEIAPDLLRAATLVLTARAVRLATVMIWLRLPKPRTMDKLENMARSVSESGLDGILQEFDAKDLRSPQRATRRTLAHPEACLADTDATAGEPWYIRDAAWPPYELIATAIDIRTEALLFVLDALEAAQRYVSEDPGDVFRRPRHCSAEELCRAIPCCLRDMFPEQEEEFMNDVGLRTSEDVGRIVFTLVEAGFLEADTDDAESDFRALRQFVGAIPSAPRP